MNCGPPLILLCLLMLSAAVAAQQSEANKTGEDGELNLQIQTGGHSSVTSRGVTDFDLAGIFGTLADEDYDRAVNLARGFQSEAPRASAVIAIAGAVFKEKKK
jgi:hypothetical protein